MKNTASLLNKILLFSSFILGTNYVFAQQNDLIVMPYGFKCIQSGAEVQTSRYSVVSFNLTEKLDPKADSKAAAPISIDGVDYPTYVMRAQAPFLGARHNTALVCDNQETEPNNTKKFLIILSNINNGSRYLITSDDNGGYLMTSIASNNFDGNLWERWQKNDFDNGPVIKKIKDTYGYDNTFRVNLD